MGTEVLAFAAGLLAVWLLAGFLGRLIAGLLKVIVVFGLVYFVATQVNWKTSVVCKGSLSSWTPLVQACSSK